MRSFSVHVVLVRTIYDSNIGASSRAMANMGVDHLILVNPKTAVTFKAQQAAATGQAALQKRKEYSNWKDFHFHEPSGIRICFTARDGKGRQVRDFQETLNWLSQEHPDFQNQPIEVSSVPIYLIFGPEDWGLSAEDLELTHFSCTIPTYGDNTSLNLGQAVLLALYILRSTWGGTQAALEGQQPPRNKEIQTAFPEESLRLWLQEMGFKDSNRRISTFSVMKRMLLQNVPNEKEIRILETVLFQGIRKLREYNELRKSLGLPAIDISEKTES